MNEERKQVTKLESFLRGTSHSSALDYPLLSQPSPARRVFRCGVARSHGIPQRLRDGGISECDLPRLAQEAMKVTRLRGNNPRGLSAAATLEIYRPAY